MFNYIHLHIDFVIPWVEDFSFVQIAEMIDYPILVDCLVEVVA